MSIDVSTKSKLILCLDKPSQLRTSDDLDVIYNCLKVIKAYSGLHPYLLQQMCMQVQYEQLKEKIVVYQGGQPEKNCYVVMSGSLIVVERDSLPDILNRNFKLQEFKIYPLINEGCAFGNNFRTDINNYHHPQSFSINLLDSKAVVTQGDCELLYMDQKVFQDIWSKNEKFLRDLNLSRDISSMDTNFSTATLDTNHSSHLPEDFNSQDISVPTRMISRSCNPSIVNAGFFIYKSSKSLLVSLPTKIGSKLSSTQVMLGEDMVTWMSQLIRINSRLLAIGIWQVLIEEGILISFTSPYCLRDTSNDYFAFVDDFCPSGSAGTRLGQTCEDLDTAVSYLMKLAPDALFRMILHKVGKERRKDELEFVYGELLHIKALSHLSSMVKRQLATLLMYEIHPRKDTVLFNQGSEGTSWYIIVKGCVDVHIKGKGVVCRLRENDDFGKLALVNNSPRAATIVLRENDCHFIKIDKDDFNRILRDVEVNTVRLTEHGKDVLLFERRSLDSPNRKMTLINPNASMGMSTYSVIAGTPEKLIDHLLENRIDLTKSYAAILDRAVTCPDPMLETFFLTYFAFLTSHGLCSLLLVYFQNFTDQTPSDGRATPIEDKELDRVVRVRKTRIVHFLYWWCRISDGGFFDDHVILGFCENLLNIFSIRKPSQANDSFNKEYLALNCLLEQFQKAEIASTKKVGQRSRFSKHQGSSKSSSPVNHQQLADITPIKAKDLTKFLVHFVDSTNCMLRLPVDTKVQHIIDTVSNHQHLVDDKLSLCEIKSDGEKILFDVDDVGVMYSLSVNGKIYLMNVDEFKDFNVIEPELNANLSPSKQDTNNVFESTSIDELAFHLTFVDWQLFKNIHVYELLFKVLGRSKFERITSNLDCFVRQFTSIQYWVATEICQCLNLQKRVNAIKKMIKLANRLSELKNISSGFAVLMGLNNSAVARLQTTWERVSNKHKKLFHELCSLLDPTRNHCAFRQYLKKTPPPIIPFVAIMLKDLTFINEANKTYFDESMINFEKMQLFAATLHQFLHCRARPMIFENITSLKKDKLTNMVDLQSFVRNLKCYDDQKILTSMSMSLEAKLSNSNPVNVTFSIDN